MKLDLDIGEEIRLEIDDSCIFKVWGERRNDGKLILKFIQLGDSE